MVNPRQLILGVAILAGGRVMAAEYQPVDVYVALRDQVLSLSPQQMNIEAPVLAVLMETGYPKAVVSLVAVADGTVSIYFSNGGGIIGSGEYQQVQEVGREFLRESELHLPQLSKTDKFPLPTESHTRFHVVTASGVHTGSALEDDLGNNRHELSPLFHAGQKLIAYIRAADEQKRTQSKE